MNWIKEEFEAINKEYAAMQDWQKSGINRVVMYETNKEIEKLMNKIVYLSGPMSNLPEHNFPAFHDATKKLRDAGFVVISPAEVHHSFDWEWERYLWKDIALLSQCNHIALLPGWHKSQGARLELAIAIKMGLKVISAIDFDPVHVSVDFNFQVAMG